MSGFCLEKNYLQLVFDRLVRALDPDIVLIFKEKKLSKNKNDIGI